MADTNLIEYHRTGDVVKDTERIVDAARKRAYQSVNVGGSGGIQASAGCIIRVVSDVYDTHHVDCSAVFHVCVI